MAGLIIVCIGLLVPGTARFISWLLQDEHPHPRWLSAVRAGAEFIAWCSGVALLPSALFLPLRAARFVLLTCLGATVVMLIAAQLARALRSMDEAGGGAFIVGRARGTARGLGAVLRHGNRIIAPHGWGELNIGPRSLGMLLGPQSLVRAHLMVLLLIPVLLAASLVWAVNSRPNLARATLGAEIGYNGLAIASCLTTALILTTIFMAILASSRVLTVSLDLRAAVRAIAEGTGFGTAAGLLTAALVPAAVFLLTRLSIADVRSGSLTPRLLVDIPAAFAIIGFTVGLFISLTRVCGRAENLVIRRLACPLVFVVLLVSTTHIGFSPASILRTLAAGISDKETIDCSAESFQAHAQDPMWLLKALNTCQEGGAYIQDDLFLWSIGTMIGLIALGAFARDFHHRAGPGGLGPDPQAPDRDRPVAVRRESPADD